MSNEILSAIADLARLRRIELNPDWADSAKTIEQDDEAAIDAVCQAIGWPPASHYEDNPRAHEFPLLVHHDDHGWGVVERLEADNRLRVVKHGMTTNWGEADRARIYDLIIPLPAGQQKFERAFDVFKTALLRRKNAFILAILATFVVNIIGLLTAIFTMQVYDRVVPRGAFSTLWVLSIGVFIALLFDFGLRVVRANLLEREAADIDEEVSEFFFSRASDTRLDTRPPSVGSMAAQLRSLEQVRQSMSASAVFAMADLPFAILFILIIMQLGGPLALVQAIAFPLAVGLALLFAYMIRRDTAASQTTNNKKNGLLVETFDAAETIKANRGQWFMLSRWNQLLEDVHKSELPVRTLQAKAGSLFGVIQQTAYVAMVAWGAVRVFNNEMTIGALIACSILAGRVNGPLIAQLPGLLVQWSYSRISLSMLDSILAMPQDRPADVDQLRPNRLNPALSLKDIEFGYPGGRSGIRIPELEIGVGERIGIIGGVGSGKSTLLKIMSGLYQPQAGQLLIDKLDMNHVADDLLRETIGYLPQDYRLVNATLRENLLLGLSDPGDDAIMDAANKTGLVNLITGHPQGLDLEISEGGRGLSGGQRVLTGLTRIFLARPKLLLLDEPTSSLDNETEALVLRSLMDWMTPETTLILVTHKVQLANFVNRLLIVAQGQLAVDGPAAEVLKSMKEARAKMRDNSSEPQGAGITTKVGVRS